ncbi:unnamed protein product [Absidia cylindrospora]
MVYGGKTAAAGQSYNNPVMLDDMSTKSRVNRWVVYTSVLHGGVIVWLLPPSIRVIWPATMGRWNDSMAFMIYILEQVSTYQYY